MSRGSDLTFSLDIVGEAAAKRSLDQFEGYVKTKVRNINNALGSGAGSRPISRGPSGVVGRPLALGGVASGPASSTGAGRVLDILQSNTPGFFPGVSENVEAQKRLLREEEKQIQQSVDQARRREQVQDRRARARRKQQQEQKKLDNEEIKDSIAAQQRRDQIETRRARAERKAIDRRRKFRRDQNTLLGKRISSGILLGAGQGLAALGPAAFPLLNVGFAAETGLRAGGPAGALGAASITSVSLVAGLVVRAGNAFARAATTAAESAELLAPGFTNLREEQKKFMEEAGMVVSQLLIEPMKVANGVIKDFGFATIGAISALSGFASSLEGADRILMGMAATAAASGIPGIADPARAFIAMRNEGIRRVEEMEGRVGVARGAKADKEALEQSMKSGQQFAQRFIDMRAEEVRRGMSPAQRAAEDISKVNEAYFKGQLNFVQQQQAIDGIRIQQAREEDKINKERIANSKRYKEEQARLEAEDLKARAKRTKEVIAAIGEVAAIRRSGVIRRLEAAFRRSATTRGVRAGIPGTDEYGIGGDAFRFAELVRSGELGRGDAASALAVASRRGSSSIGRVDAADIGRMIQSRLGSRNDGPVTLGEYTKAMNKLLEALRSLGKDSRKDSKELIEEVKKIPVGIGMGVFGV